MSGQAIRHSPSLGLSFCICQTKELDYMIPRVLSPVVILYLY